MAYYYNPEVIYNYANYGMGSVCYQSSIPATDPAIWDIPSTDSPKPVSYWNYNGGFHPVNEAPSPSIWDLPPEPRKLSKEDLSAITPEIYAAGQEIGKYVKMYGVPTYILLTNFVNYIQRNNLAKNTENFLFYLKHWAQLDLSVGVLEVETAVEVDEEETERLEVEVRNGTTFYVTPPKPKVRRDWPKGPTHEDFLRLKKAAEEEFEKKTMEEDARQQSEEQ